MQMHPLALAALLATVATAQAQTSSSPPTGNPTTTALPEVKVTDEANSAGTEGSGQYTAREVSVGKLQQAPRETPQSLSVVTRQQLDDRNLTKVEDAIKLSTGMTVTRFDGAGNYNTFQARGFDLGSIQLDGVPIPQGNYSTLDTAMYDRIEVLRGPAGLLQGASEPGGTVNLVRKRAPAKLAIGADAAAGSFGLRRGTVDVRAAIDQGLPTYANGRLADLPRGAFAGLRANRQDLETTDVFAELEHRLDGGGLVRLSARDIDRTAFYRSARANSALAADGSFTMEPGAGVFPGPPRTYAPFRAPPVRGAGPPQKLLGGASHNEGKSWD